MKAPRQGGAADAFLALILGGGFFTLLRGVGQAFDSRRPTFALRVPQCDVCGREGPPVGRGPDYTARRLTFDTHPRFADALAAQQREVERRHRGHQEGRSHS